MDESISCGLTLVGMVNSITSVIGGQGSVDGYMRIPDYLDTCNSLLVG